MEKLELKHLAPYLPYDLKVKAPFLGTTDRSIRILYPIMISQFLSFEMDIKPILRPLSDLTKEIEVNGEKFVPSDKFGISKNSFGDYAFNIDDGTVSWAIWAVIRDLEELFKYHFDVFGLIDKGLAIDINTL